MANSKHISLASAIASVPTPDGRVFAELFAHGTLAVELYAPKGIDPQTPHSRDEVYVVARGAGIFYDGAERVHIAPGDFLFVAAGRTHRFEDFTDDLAVWVFFYGPDGGERLGPA
ncbi:MAG: cupin domain-containing protein [Gemmatimonadota bacterium]